MDLLEDMIKKAFKKIDDSNSDFCSTPTLTAKKTVDKMARSLLLGKGSMEDLLSNPGKKQGKRCSDKACTHQH